MQKIHATHLKSRMLLSEHVNDESTAETLATHDRLVSNTSCGAAIKCGKENMIDPTANIIIPHPTQVGLCP